MTALGYNPKNVGFDPSTITGHDFEGEDQTPAFEQYVNHGAMLDMGGFRFNPEAVYEQSLLIAGGSVYAVRNNLNPLPVGDNALTVYRTIVPATHTYLPASLVGLQRVLVPNQHNMGEGITYLASTVSNHSQTGQHALYDVESVLPSGLDLAGSIAAYIYLPKFESLYKNIVVGTYPDGFANVTELEPEPSILRNIVYWERPKPPVDPSTPTPTPTASPTGSPSTIPSPTITPTITPPTATSTVTPPSNSVPPTIIPPSPSDESLPPSPTPEVTPSPSDEITPTPPSSEPSPSPEPSGRPTIVEQIFGDIPVFTIGGTEIPLAGRSGEKVWALLNLILAILGILISIGLCVYYLVKKKSDQGDEEKDAAADDLEEQRGDRRKKKALWTLIAVVLGIVSIIVFFLTENMRYPMVFIDGWTILMLVLFVTELVFMILAIRNKKIDEDEDNGETPQVEA